MSQNTEDFLDHFEELIKGGPFAISSELLLPELFFSPKLVDELISELPLATRFMDLLLDFLNSSLDERIKEIYEFAEQKNMLLTAKAMKLVEKLYQGQNRNDGTPAINHAVSVACWLINHGVHDDEIIAAALLHDALEDGNITYDDLVCFVGKRVADLVLGLSEEKKTGQEDAAQLAARAIKYFSGVVATPDKLLLKGDDRLNNLRDMIRSYSLEKSQAKLAETVRFIVPFIIMARRRHPGHRRNFEALAGGIVTMLYPLILNNINERRALAAEARESLLRQQNLLLRRKAARARRHRSLLANK